MQKSLSFRQVNAPQAIVALGANLPSDRGGPLAAVLSALGLLACAPGLSLLRVSRCYASPAYPAGSGPDYVNAAALLDSAVPPEALLMRLHEIEAVLGRQRAGAARWSARPIDLDLLAVGGEVRPDAAVQDGWRTLLPHEQARQAPDELILPHPRLQDRAFVLIPMAEIAPAWRHPATGLTVMQMLDALPAEARTALRPL